MTSVIICSTTTAEQHFYKSMENDSLSAQSVDSSLFIQASECSVISWCVSPSSSHPGRGSWERGLEADLE